MKTLRMVTAGVLLLAPAFGYIRIGYIEASSTTFIPLKRTDNKAIQFYINDKIVAGASSSAIGASVKVISDGSDPVTAIREAFAQWKTAVVVQQLHNRWLDGASADPRHEQIADSVPALAATAIQLLDDADIR